MIGAFAPSIVASQTRNSPLDARTPAIPAPEGSRVFQVLTLLGELAHGWDGDLLDAGLFELGLGLSRMDPTISCDQMRWVLKHLLVVGHRFRRLPVLVGVRENLVARHDAPPRPHRG